MSMIDKQMFLLRVEQGLGEFIPAKKVRLVLTEVDNALDGYEISSIPTGGPDGNSEDLLQYFLNAKSIEGRSDKTIEHYRYVLTRLLTDTGVPFTKMTVYHIRGYFSRERERGISASTLGGNRSCYNSFFGWLSRENLIEQNPMINLTVIKQKKVIRKPYSEVHLRLLDDAAANIRDRAIMAVLFSTGCRISELCGANQNDVDWQNHRLTVRGKGNKERTVYLNDVAENFLQRYLDERNDNKEPLFINRRHGRLQPGGVRNMLKRTAERCGVDNVHPHRFRRTLATHLIDKGMPIQEVAAILGHEKIDTTMRYVYIDERNVANNFHKYA